jgi:predicted acetyltransferase
MEVRACTSVAELRDVVNVISLYFGTQADLEDVERFGRLLGVERAHAVWEGDRPVAGAGALSFRMSVPGGGTIPAAGITIVGVLPTHRRRGLMRSLMRAQLDDCRARGDVAGVLWASEATIYNRYGYGLASRTGSLTLPKERAAFAASFSPRGSVRLVGLEEAMRLFPPLYEQQAARRAGMMSRSHDWWEIRRLADHPTRRQGGPKQLAVLELDGEPAGYAIYKVTQEWTGGSSSGSVEILEAVTPTPEATRELWRWLLDHDWTSRFTAELLPLDHPLYLLLAEARRMQLRVGDGVWLRLIDIPAAMAARSFAADAAVVVELSDPFVPENAGRWRIGPGGAERVDAAAEISLDVTGLGSVYLGGFSFADLVRGSRAEELVAGAVERADALFRTDAEPWCAEIF